MFVRQRRELNGREATRFQPMDCRRVNGHSLFRRNVRTVLQIVVLALLLGFQVKTSEATQILLAHRLVDGGAATDTLSVVVGRVRPPIGLHFDVTQDHFFYRRRQTWNLPGNVGLPAAPGFRQMLQNGSGFVLFDTFGHHVQDVVHDGGAELQIKVGFDPLLRHSLGHTFRVTAFELTR